MSKARMGIKLSKETRRKMSESKKGTKQSEETIRKRGESRARTVAREDYVSPLKGKYAGKKNPYYGKTHSEEIRRKMKGRKVSEETRKVIRRNRLSQIFPVKDTKIEKILQSMLKDNEIKYETHRMYVKRGLRILGQPDIFIKPNICIYADGDYWHANPNPWIKHGKIQPGFKANDTIVGGQKVSERWKRDKAITKKLHDFASKSCSKTSPEKLLSNSNIFGPGPSWPKSSREH